MLFQVNGYSRGMGLTLANVLNSRKFNIQYMLQCEPEVTLILITLIL